MNRSRRAGTAALAVLALAGCAARATGHGGSPQRAGSLPGAIVPASTRTAPARELTGIRTAMTSVAPATFGVAASPGSRFVFVSRAGSVVVLRAGSSSAPPSPVRSIAVPGALQGETPTPDGRYLLVAAGAGAAVISVARAEDGAAHPVLGALTAPITRPGRLRQRCATRRLRDTVQCHGSAIEAAVTPDGRLAFVSIEYSDEIAVFRLARALRAGFGAADYAGAIPAGGGPVGLAISPDGRWLYATSETQHAPGAGAADAAAMLGKPGNLTVISIPRAGQDPARSVAATVAAGFQPVRVILSANGAVAWVTARASDALLAFSTTRLRTDPRRALIADVQVGEAPVGLALAAHGTRIIVANSNRFSAAGAAASLYVISVPAALARQPAVLGALPAGSFPREMTLGPTAQPSWSPTTPPGSWRQSTLQACPDRSRDSSQRCCAARPWGHDRPQVINGTCDTGGQQPCGSWPPHAKCSIHPGRDAAGYIPRLQGRAAPSRD